jgi:hypothetical protein
MMAPGVTDHIWSVEEMVTYQTMADHQANFLIMLKSEQKWSA